MSSVRLAPILAALIMSAAALAQDPTPVSTAAPAVGTAHECAKDTAAPAAASSKDAAAPTGTGCPKAAKVASRAKPKAKIGHDHAKTHKLM